MAGRHPFTVGPVRSVSQFWRRSVPHVDPPSHREPTLSSKRPQKLVGIDLIVCLEVRRRASADPGPIVLVSCTISSRKPRSSLGCGTEQEFRANFGDFSLKTTRKPGTRRSKSARRVVPHTNPKRERGRWRRAARDLRHPSLTLRVTAGLSPRPGGDEREVSKFFLRKFSAPCASSRQSRFLKLPAAHRLLPTCGAAALGEASMVALSKCSRLAQAIHSCHQTATAQRVFEKGVLAAYAAES